MDIWFDTILAGSRVVGAGTPDDLRNHISATKLLGYWKTDANYVSESGGTVQYMADLTGNGWTLGNGGTAPTWNATDASFNNRPSITFTEPQYLTSSFIPRNDDTGNYAVTGSCIGIIFKPISTTNDYIWMTWGNVDAGTTALTLRPRTTTYFRGDSQYSGSTAIQRADAGQEFSTTGSYVGILQIKTSASAQTLELYTNGLQGTTKIGSFAQTQANKINDGYVAIASRYPYAAANDSALTLVEAFICADTLTTAELNAVLQYASTQYGIPSGAI